jgi:hypothetical protein
MHVSSIAGGRERKWRYVNAGGCRVLSHLAVFRASPISAERKDLKMSVKGLTLAATVALLGLSLGGCVDGGPYYGDYAYSGYYGPAYYDPYYGPYYGGVIYGGYRDGYYRPRYRDHRRHSHDRPGNYNRPGNYTHHSSGPGRSDSRAANVTRDSRPSYRSGRQGGTYQNRHRRNDEQQ